MWVVFGKYLPVAGHGFYNPDNHFFVLAVFELYAVSAFKDIIIFTEAGCLRSAVMSKA
jgi:hypothetical protein